MGLWGKKPTEPVRWDCAREITKVEAESGTLPPGWYIYPDGYVWYGLRPGNGGMERSGSCRDPKELIGWLGVPVPEPRSVSSVSPRASTSLDELVRQTVHTAANPPLPDMGRLQETYQPHTDELREESLSLSKEAPESPEPPSAEQSEAKSSASEKIRPRGRTRNNELHFWFSDAELKRFQVRVSRSGLNQSEFLRRAALTGRIVIEDRSPVSTAIMDDLELIRAELGRQGGMLKMVIKPNRGQRELRPEEWSELVQAIRYLEHTKDRLGKLEEKLNGNRQA